jgi:hypothetical protein
MAPEGKPVVIALEACVWRSQTHRGLTRVPCLVERRIWRRQFPRIHRGRNWAIPYSEGCGLS